MAGQVEDALMQDFPTDPGKPGRPAVPVQCLTGDRPASDTASAISASSYLDGSSQMMNTSIAAWIAVYILGLTRGAFGQEFNSTENEPVQSDISINTEGTTILFSGFFLPSTEPPTFPTTFVTEIPEEIENTESHEVHTESHSNGTEPRLEELRDKTQAQTTEEPKPSQKQERRWRPRVLKVIEVQKHEGTSENPLVKPVISNDVLGQKEESRSIPPVVVDKESAEFVQVTNEQPYDLERGRLVEEHPCRRACGTGRPMTCRYRFRVEWYESLSKACYHCPSNLTDCFREDCVPADGVQRPLVLVNRKFPGPGVEVCLGDTVEILLENRLMSETTTVHWHGLHQRESPYMDGVPFVSQCPVLPRADFLYRYIAANPGTHFWHSHSGVQRADGMFGPLVVRSGADPQAGLYDEDLSEHVLQLVDWSHGPTLAVFTGHHHARTDNKPPTLLVNGRGVFAGGPPASFTVQQGKRYRFRMINAGVLNCPIELSIDNHTMVVISSDGSDIAPIEVDTMVTYAGERWDFILSATAPIGNYWMRFRGLMDCDERFTSAHTVSVLHYENSANDLPMDSIGYKIGFKKGLQLNPLNEKESEPSINANELHSMIQIDRTLKPTPDQRVILSYDFNRIDNEHLYKKGVYGFYQVADRRERVLTPQINHVSLALPPFPLLSQYSDLENSMLCSHRNLSTCSRKYCECLNIIELDLGAVVELVLIDIGHEYDANHPFHLHGHAFRVVAMDRIGNVTSVEEVLELDSKGSIKRNLVDPPEKDTVTVPDGGYTIVRFIADNPGYWMFHCHLEFHVELGMAVIFKVGDHSDFPPVPPGFPKCGNYIPRASAHENEVYWTYNTTSPSGSFTLRDWWPLNRNKNSASQMEPTIVFKFAVILIVSYYNLR